MTDLPIVVEYLGVERPALLISTGIWTDSEGSEDPYLGSLVQFTDVPGNSFALVRSSAIRPVLTTEGESA